mgnify:FL=1|jgi:hypothetical protein|tara:strand:- start:508 stop:1713 length:1206 start_codon:yes stop_codon:yes gene_type:complete
MVLAVTLTLFPFGGPAILAQEATTVRGQVINGTADAEIPEALSVLMLITGADGRLAGTGQANADSDGDFVFENVQVEDGSTYTVSVDHLGVFYGTSLTHDNLAEELTLTVYETTRDASVIHVERQVMVIAAVDKDNQSVSAIEFVRLVNPSDRTLLPDLTNLEQISFLRFALPPNPAELNVQSDLPGGDIVSIGTGFALTSPVVPGAHSIDFSYVFPYEEDTVSYRQSLVQGAGIFQVLMPETFPDMAVSNLTSVDPVNIQDTSYRAYEVRDLPQGQGLQVEITGLPLPGALTRFSNTITGGRFWQIAIPSALGVTLAFILLWGLIRGYRPNSGVDGQSMASAALDPAERAAVVRAVAALDLQYQEGHIPESDYRAQRQGLLNRILSSSGDSSTSSGDVLE